jgi:hypothetical protein
MTTKFTAEQMAKLLFGTGDAEAKFTPEQQDQIKREIEAMEARMKNVGIEPTTNALTEAIYKQVQAEPIEPIEPVEPASYGYRGGEPTSIEPFEYVPNPIPGINVPFGYPASEIPDEATKAFLRELKKADKPSRESAHGFLEEASQAMKQRAALRDAEDGERTAAQIAKVFNAITGHEISEADAWMFLLVMKIVRSRNGKYHRDDYVDGSSYFALLGECESINRE